MRAQAVIMFTLYYVVLCVSSSHTTTRANVDFLHCRIMGRSKRNKNKTSGGAPLSSIAATADKKISIVKKQKGLDEKGGVANDGGLSPRSIGELLRNETMCCQSEHCPAKASKVDHVHVQDLKDMQGVGASKFVLAEVVHLHGIIEANGAGKSGFEKEHGHFMPSTAAKKMKMLVKALNPGKNNEGCTIISCVVNQYWKPMQMEHARKVSASHDIITGRVSSFKLLFSTSA